MNRRTRTGTIIVAASLAVVAFDVAALTTWARGSWDAKLSLLLQIIAVYGIGLAFMRASKTLQGFGEVMSDMTSPNLFKFVAGNFVFLSIIASAASIGLRPARAPGAASALSAVGLFLLVLIFPVLLAYLAFHVFVVMPLAYLAYVPASAVVQSIASASGDIEMASIPGPAGTGEPQTMRLKEVIAADSVAFKSVLVGIPAAILSLVTRLFGMFAAV